MSPKSIILILTGIVCLLAHHASADKRNTAKFNKVICQVHDKAIMSNSSCRAKPVSRYQTLFTLYAHLTKKVNNVMLRYQLYKKFTVYRPFLINATENFCHFFTKRSSITYLKLFMPIIGIHTNANHSCPYEGDLLIKELPMDAGKLNGFWPSGEYRMDVDAYFNKVPTSVVTVSSFLQISENM